MTDRQQTFASPPTLSPAGRSRIGDDPGTHSRWKQAATAHLRHACQATVAASTGLARNLWQHLPAGWWVMPAFGLGLLIMLASGYGLPWFIGKYAWTGKDFQEILGPSLLTGAVVVAAYLWLMNPVFTRAWMLCLPVALLCREIHFSGTGTGIYIALIVIAVSAVRHRDRLQSLWDCQPTNCLWLGACSWYVLAVSVDSGVWKFLPHAHWWSVNLEETLESGGHLAILLGVLLSVLMVGNGQPSTVRRVARRIPPQVTSEPGNRQYGV